MYVFLKNELLLSLYVKNEFTTELNIYGNVPYLENTSYQIANKPKNTEIFLFYLDLLGQGRWKSNLLLAIQQPEEINSENTKSKVILVPVTFTLINYTTLRTKLIFEYCA